MTVVVLIESTCAAGCCAAAALILRRAARTVAEVNLRITQLAAGPAAAQGHPFNCPHCLARFKHTSWTAQEGQRGFCGQCMVWVQIAPPPGLPEPREGR